MGDDARDRPDDSRRPRYVLTERNVGYKFPAPGAISVAAAGDVIATVGRAFTFTAIERLAVSPAVSLTVAVIVWAPAASADTVSLVPLPSTPATLELHTTAAPRSPSSLSAASPSRSSSSRRRIQVG